jgi:hypothetical protein
MFFYYNMFCIKYLLYYTKKITLNIAVYFIGNFMATKIELLLNKARKSISNYCFEDCHSYCCRNGYLVMNEKQTIVLTNNKIKEYIEKGLLTILKNNDYSFNLNKNNHSCPNLVDFKCIIHKKRLRPNCCKNFPLFLDEEKKIIMISNRCFATKDGKFYPYISQFKKLGYKIIYGIENSDVDYSNIIEIK